MRRVAVLALVLMSLGIVGYAASGQDVVRGTVVDGHGQPLSDCAVGRGLRLGVGFGGFDALAYATGPDGQFALPVNRGFNRLTFACRGGLEGVATTLVLRGRDARAVVVLDGP